jgi:hypothetical protein
MHAVRRAAFATNYRPDWEQDSMARVHYGALILEGSWAQEVDYLTDSRSTARLYTALEDLLSLEGTPIRLIHRPLLNCRFAQDIRDFVRLAEKQSGGTVIILSAHGARIRTKKGSRRRVLRALDGKLNLSSEIKQVNDVLGKTILVLDSCEVGQSLDLFQRAAKALAVIGFARSVDWVDSTTFILALLNKLDDAKFFTATKKIEGAAKEAIGEMWKDPYAALAKLLGAEKAA